MAILLALLCESVCHIHGRMLLLNRVCVNGARRGQFLQVWNNTGVFVLSGVDVGKRDGN